MLGVRLGEVAARAEILRLRQLARRTAARFLLGVFAFVFIMAALVEGHIALALWLAPRIGALDAVLITGGGDLAVAVILILVVALKGPGRVEREALDVRENARRRMMEELTLTAAIGALARRLGVRNIVALLRWAARALGGRP